MNILIGGKQFKAISVVDLTKDTEVPEYKVEEQFSVTDHIILKPAEFELELQLFRDRGEVETLNQLYEAKQPISLTTEFGHYDHMVLKSVRFRDSDSENIVYATIYIKQILKAKAKTATISLPELMPDESQYPGSDTAVTPQSKTVPDVPEKQENKSWLDSILSWFGGGGS
jgi:hypothetical protein